MLAIINCEYINNCNNANNDNCDFDYRGNDNSDGNNGN